MNPEHAIDRSKTPPEAPFPGTPEIQPGLEEILPTSPEENTPLVPGVHFPIPTDDDEEDSPAPWGRWDPKQPGHIDGPQTRQ